MFHVSFECHDHHLHNHTSYHYFCYQNNAKHIFIRACTWISRDNLVRQYTAFSSFLMEYCLPIYMEDWLSRLSRISVQEVNMLPNWVPKWVSWAISLVISYKQFNIGKLGRLSYITVKDTWQSIWEPNIFNINLRILIQQGQLFFFFSFSLVTLYSWCSFLKTN